MSSDTPPPLKGVTVGLPLVGFGVALLWFLCFWSLLGLYVEGTGFVYGWPWDVMLWAGTVFLTLQIGGHLLCLTVPRGWRARGTEAAALGLTVLYLGLFLVFFLTGWVPLGGLGLWVLRMLAPTAHLLFLATLASRIDQEELAQRAQALMPFLLLLLVFPVINYLAFVLLGAVAVLWVIPVLLIGLELILELIVLVRFLNLHLAIYHGIFRYQETFAERRKLHEAGWVEPSSEEAPDAL